MLAAGFGRDRNGRPPIRALPRVGCTRPRIIFIVVDLPAPLGPRKPVTRPGRTVNERSSTTARPPYSLVSPLTSIVDPAEAVRRPGLDCRVVCDDIPEG